MMERLELLRLVDDGQATVGRLSIADDPAAAWYTIERPWLDNKPNVSCIPCGTYLMAPRHYNRGGYDAWEVLDVPGRSHILVHVANWPKNVEGCIGTGMGATSSHDGLMVTRSRDAFSEFMANMAGEERAVLVVSSVYGGRK